MLGPRTKPSLLSQRSTLQPCVGRAGLVRSSIRRTFSFRFPCWFVCWLVFPPFTADQPTITDEQRDDFGQLVENTVGQIESEYLLPHSGIRFPQNPCTGCPYIGLCLGQQELVDTILVRRSGDGFGLFDELAYLNSAHAVQAGSPASVVRADQG
jgi:hypothetical protein